MRCPSSPSPNHCNEGAREGSSPLRQTQVQTKGCGVQAGEAKADPEQNYCRCQNHCQRKKKKNHQKNQTRKNQAHLELPEQGGKSPYLGGCCGDLARAQATNSQVQ
jgi:hypothetical protein